MAQQSVGTSRPGRRAAAARLLASFLLALATATAPGGAAAQEPTLEAIDGDATAAPFGREWPLDEPELVGLASRRNPALVGTVLSVEAARQRLAGEVHFVPWLLEASASYTHSDTPIRDALSRGMQIRDTFDWRVAVVKAWSFGLEVLVAFDNTIVRSETPLSFDVGGVEVTDRRVTGPYNVSVLTLRLTQHLLRGREMDVNLLPERAAAREIRTAQLALEEQTSQVVLDVLDTYWDLARAQRDVALRQRSIERIERQREITEELIAAGTLAPIELDVLEQQRVSAEEAVLLGELAREQAELGVRRAAGLELDGDGRRLVAAAPEHVPPLPAASADALVELAQARSYEVRALEARVELADLEIERARAELLPTLDVFVQLSQQGVDDAIGIDDGLFFDAWKQVFGLEFGAVGAGVVFSMPLDDARTEAAHDLAVLERERLAAELSAAQRAVETSVRAQLAGVERTRERLGLLERSVALAERNLATGQERLAAGRLTTLDLVRLQEELEEAEARLTGARIELIEQTLRLEHAVGTLLERLGVELVEAPLEVRQDAP